MEPIEEVRAELDKHAQKAGWRRSPNGTLGLGMPLWSYSFGNAKLECLGDEDKLTVRLSLESPTSALCGLVSHALDSTRSVKEHEAQTTKEFVFRWDKQTKVWTLEVISSSSGAARTQSNWHFGSKNLAQYCFSLLSTCQ